MSIRILPLNVSNFISAGEIIHNPASVVKELVENSIDSGATRIEIDIKNGGMQLISVKDNGCGISKNDLSLSLLSHSTSKIFSIKDLDNISTLGFRGEALSSINAVSKIILSSCDQVFNKIGWMIASHNKKFMTLPVPIAHSKGTVISVSNLFFNQPVRRQFIKSEYLEFIKIDEIVKRLSLSMNNISFLLKHNNKLIRFYNRSDLNFSVTNRINSICGFNFTNKSVFVQFQCKYIKIKGWIYLYCKNNLAKKFRYCYINQRFVSDRVVRHAIFQAVRELYHNRFNISYIVYLSMASDYLDINIHPEKKEVKFINMRYVHSFVYQTILSSLHKSDFFKKDNSLSSHWIVKNRVSAGRNIFSEETLNINNNFENCTNIDNFNKNSKNNKIIHHKKMFNFNKISSKFGNLLSLINDNYLLVERNQYLFLCSLPILKKIIYKSKLNLGVDKGLKTEKLTKTYLIIFSKEQYKIFMNYKNFFLHIGFNFNIQFSLIKFYLVPSILLNQNLENLIRIILDYLFQNKEVTLLDLISIIIKNIKISILLWDHLQIVSILSEFERYCKEFSDSDSILKLLQPIDISSALFNYCQYEY